jgi:hypothetical protein
LIICRDCFIHLKNKDIEAAIENIKRSGSKYLLASTARHAGPNEELGLAFWRPVDLELAPFCLPAPVELIPDASLLEIESSERFLGVWLISEL